MKEQGQMVRNAAVLMLATVVNKGIAFLTFPTVARLTGPEVTGVFFYSIAITSIFVTFADLGMTPVVIRSVAGKDDKAPRLIGAALSLKIFLAPLAALTAWLYAYGRGGDAAILATVSVALFVMTADTFHLVLYGLLRGKQRLWPEAAGMLVGQCLTSAVSLFAAWKDLGPVALAAALACGSLWNAAWAISHVYRLGLRPSWPKLPDVFLLCRYAWPFALAGIAVKVYSYVDTLFIERLHGTIAVAMYAAAYKLTYALQFLPLTFTAALYPALAAAWAEKRREDLERVFGTSVRAMTVLGALLSAGLSALALPFMSLVYGSAYEAAVPVFRILPWVLLPIFLDFPIGALLNATHRPLRKTAAMLITMLVNIGLNAFLVPIWGPQGAAWAGVISFWLLVLLGMWFLREDKPEAKIALHTLFQGLCAAFLSWCSWELLRRTSPFPVAFFGGAVCGLVWMFVVRLATTEDVRRLFMMLRRKTSAPQSELHDA